MRPLNKVEQEIVDRLKKTNRVRKSLNTSDLRVEYRHEGNYTFALVAPSNTTSTSSIKLGFAKYNPNDCETCQHPYNKSLGRQIAFGRAISKKGKG